MGGRKLTKWKKTGKYAWHENTSEYQFRVSPKFKTSKQAEAYAAKKGLGGTHFTVRDKPTDDICKADKLDKYGYFTERMGGKPSTTQLKEREGPDIDAHLEEWVHHNDAGQPLYYGDGYFLNTDDPKSEFKGKYKLAKDTKNNALRQIEYEGEYIKNARTGEEI